jgi:hypothetical protein
MNESEVESFVEEKCSELDIETYFKEKRVARKKRTADEQSKDDRVDDPIRRF